MSDTPKLNFVAVVTREHGAKFADAWYETDSMEDACALAEIIEWPELDEAAQLRGIDVQDEIIERVFNELRNTIAETFARIASEVLDRERQR